MADRSKAFEAWLRAGLDDDKIKLLVDMEKGVRIFTHVWDLCQTVDQKGLRIFARADAKIRESYESETATS